MKHPALRLTGIGVILIFWLINRQLDAVVCALLLIWGEIADISDKGEK